MYVIQNCTQPALKGAIVYRDNAMTTGGYALRTNDGQ